MIKKNYLGEEGTFSEAIYSDCEKYRYILSRTWGKNLKKIMFVGLNPSTATELKNDPTVTRMINYAKSWKFGSITVCNAFAFRATFPEDLKKCREPIGKDNDSFIMEEAKKSEMVVAAWGNHGRFLQRSKQLLKLLNKVYYFGLTTAGEPKHPLYLKANLKPVLLKM